MTELKLQVVIDPSLPSVVEGAICFETGASAEQLQDRSTFTYEHHGSSWTERDHGALTSLFEDLAYGVALPLSFVTHEVRDIDNAVAASLFLQRDLLVHPSTPAFVNAVDLFHRYGESILAHIPRDLGRFFYLMRSNLPVKGQTRAEVGERLGVLGGWVRDYLLEERLPHLGPTVPLVRVLDHGTNGFVLAECAKPSLEAMVGLYRQGFLRGVLLGPDQDSYRRVLISKKSKHIAFNLERAATVLNEMERVAGMGSIWTVSGLSLSSPEEGTQILVSHLMQVLIRC